MNQVAVIIPVYKSELTWNEEISFHQTLRVLGNHPIILVCPEALDISTYNAIAGTHNVIIHRESFADKFFANIAAYNRLLLSEKFYLRFERYEYVLIAQLDTYVFRDELELWCSKGYDYVGAPLFRDKMDIREGKVGNGGLSLRRVRTHIDYFRGVKLVIPVKDIARNINITAKPYTRWLVWILMAMGWHNTPRSFAEIYQYNEDMFWSLKLDDTNYRLNKPSIDEAMEFAWERFPSDIYIQVGHMPMGCHAWEKYEYETFWKKYII